jgi:muramoyltetrapeptide carboxypeptidase LdcA involved in peptidoglycan recycling
MSQDFKPLLRPPRLFPGDKIAAVTLSWGGPGAIPHRFEIGRQQLENEFGINIVPTRNALRDPDWIKKNPKARADDLMEAFSDPTIKGIFSTIGGDDSIRTLPFLDLDMIRANPKVFLGFSDSSDPPGVLESRSRFILRLFYHVWIRRKRRDVSLFCR